MHIPQSKKEKSAVLSKAMLVAFLQACGIGPSSPKRLFWCAFFLLRLPKGRGVGGQENKLDLEATNSISRPLLSLLLPSSSLVHSWPLPLFRLLVQWMGYDGWMEVDSFDSFDSFTSVVKTQQSTINKQTNNSRNQQANRHNNWDRTEGEAR